jgi:hypothetical protein
MPQRRLSSRIVQVGMIGTLSMTLAACSSNSSTTAYCVDRDDFTGGQYQIVNDDNCGNSSYGRYFWYYGGSRVGNRIHKGTTLRPKKGSITSYHGKSIQRGGFGSKSHSHSSGG